MDPTFTLTTKSGGVILATDIPCFCADTPILTDRGERAVEAGWWPLETSGV